MAFCFVSGFGVFKENMFFFVLNENYYGFHMRYSLFLHYEWVLQNFE